MTCANGPSVPSCAASRSSSPVPAKPQRSVALVASHTPLPVIAVPMKTSDLGGMDSLLSTVQMPTGVPLACVAINGTKNAAILATQILGTAMPEYRDAIIEYKRELAGK